MIGPGVIGGCRQHIGAAVLVDHLLQIRRAQPHVVFPVVEALGREGHTGVAGENGRGAGQELHHAARAAGIMGRGVEVALLAGDGQGEGQLGAAFDLGGQHRIAALGQDVAALGGGPHDPHADVLFAIAFRQVDQQGVFLGVGQGLGGVEHDRPQQVALAELGQDARRAHGLAAFEAGAVGGGGGRVVAKVDLGDAGLLGGQLAVEGGEVLAALGIEVLGADGVAARLRRPAPPVEGAALGDGRGAHLLDMGEVLVGEGGVVQLLQRQPAGEELRLGIFDT